MKMNLCEKLIRPGLLYFNNEFREDLVLKIDQNGRIEDILEADKLVGDAHVSQVAQIVRLENEVNLVNHPCFRHPSLGFLTWFCQQSLSCLSSTTSWKEWNWRIGSNEFLEMARCNVRTGCRD